MGLFRKALAWTGEHAQDDGHGIIAVLAGACVPKGRLAFHCAFSSAVTCVCCSHHYPLPVAKALKALIQEVC